ncbi:hypothetical protein N7495_009564 [Penicillium taxi]|uniref:uncharacterized protein n=1 Tax=Penicillium taxi TaxID=168475 RepID=UPI002544FED1|nr:uncharacterized protein N7495_009564 [Penicillium taxi]KAJ5885054.1 hypothetical protein N7495_009564 [Penicillium taxi]
MRVNLSSSLILLLLPALSNAVTPIKSSIKPTASPSRPAYSLDSRYVDADPAPKPVDAPVDGKDGRPHAGPWVETNAERDRKNTKGGDDSIELVVPSSDHVGIDGKSIPQSNSGVMDDPTRAGPKEGTRGTENKVSDKAKDTLKTEKVPGAPKEAPPCRTARPKSCLLLTAARCLEVEASLLMQIPLECSRYKPADLPGKPHDIPHPKSPSQAKSDPLAAELGSSGLGSSTSSSTYSKSSVPVESDGLHSLIFSFTMIIVSEIGDKTFLVAALMAMRHPRLVVFSSAFSALITMTILSAVLGHAVPTLIPKTLTKFMAGILFLVFGAKMLKEGREMSPDEGVGEEMREVEMELEEKEQEQIRLGRRRSSVTPHNLEAGRAGGRPKSRGSHNRLPSPPESVSSSSSRGTSPSHRRRFNDMMNGVSNLFSLLLSPAWVQTFVMTFLGEWGDRSQIATIAMAAGQDYWWVTIGAITGHGICTAAAVIGGRAIAGRVSMRVVTLGGATAFLIFGVIYLIEGFF